MVKSKAGSVQILPCLIRTGNGVMKLMQSCLSHGCLNKIYRVFQYVRETEPAHTFALEIYIYIYIYIQKQIENLCEM